MPSIRINIPPLTRLLLILLIGLSLIYQAINFRHGSAPSARGWIVLIPGVSIFYPWVYATSALAEENVLTMLIGGATIFYGGRYLERAWGSSDFAKFMAIVTVIPLVTAGILYQIAWTTSGFAPLGQVHLVEERAEEANVLNSRTSIQGSIPIQAAFVVAFKQLVPEHTVTILRGVVKVRVKHFPAIFLFANTLSGFVFFTDTAAILAWLGFLSSWTYLRFYKPQPDLSGASTGAASTIRGDASETFAFAYFWPDAVQPPIATLADAVFQFLVAIRICTPFTAENIESSNQQASARGEGLPNIMNPTGARRGGGSKREEAERRRALALKALDQRLAAAASRPNPAVPPPTSAGSSNAAAASANTDTVVAIETAKDP